MGVTTTFTNKPINPRGNDASPLGYNRAALYSGKALDFDGTNDSVSVGSANFLGLGTGSFSFAWHINSSESVDFQSLIDYRHTSGIGVLLDHRLGGIGGALQTAEGNFAFDITSATSSVSGDVFDGKWHHVVFVADRSTSNTRVTFYIDGQLHYYDINTNTQTSTIEDGQSLYLGGQNGSTQFIDASLSNFKTFSTALTAAQVADLYNNPEKIVPTGVSNDALKLWLPMMEGAGTTCYDGSGNGNHGTISGATWTHGIGSPVAQTAVIDWNKYSITDTTDYATASNSTIASEGTIVFKHVALANVSNTYFFSYGTNSTGQSRSIRQYNGNYEFIGWGSPNVQDKATSEALEVGVIKNVAYTWDASGNAKVYIDGSNVLDTTLTLSTPTSSKIGVNIAPTHTGQISNQIMFYAGLYDEVLTESQIQGIQDGTTNPESVSGLVHFWRNSNDWQDEVGSADLTENDNAGKVLFPQTLTTGRDLAGNIFANVRKQGALNLDGNSWAEVHDNASLDITDAITLEAWIDNTNAYDSIRYLFDKSDNSTNGFELRLTSQNGVQIVFRSLSTISKVATIPTSGWVHVVATYDGANIKMYINGSLQNTTASTGTITANDYPLTIGGDIQNSNYSLNKPIAQPRIYNRALTAEEVLRNYNSEKNTYQ